MRARAFLKGLMPMVLKHPSVTLMLSFVGSVLFFLSRLAEHWLAIYAGLVLSSPLVGFVAVAYDDKCFGCLDKWVWFSTDLASAWTVSCNCLA